MISMDDNGATCGRIAKILLSNSALMKYASSHQLYCFDIFVQFVYFLEIEHDTDVLTLIQIE